MQKRLARPSAEVGLLVRDRPVMVILVCFPCCGAVSRPPPFDHLGSQPEMDRRTATAVSLVALFAPCFCGASQAAEYLTGIQWAQPAIVDPGAPAGLPPTP